MDSIESRHARLLGKRSDIDLYLCDANPFHLNAAKAWVNLRGATDSFVEKGWKGVEGVGRG